MRILFSPLAIEDLEGAASYLEFEFEGLGERFRREVGLAAQRIAQHPQAWTIERGEIRRHLLHRFPYKLLYSIEPDHIIRANTRRKISPIILSVSSTTPKSGSPGFAAARMNLIS